MFVITKDEWINCRTFLITFNLLKRKCRQHRHLHLLITNRTCDLLSTNSRVYPMRRMDCEHDKLLFMSELLDVVNSKEKDIIKWIDNLDKP